MSNDYKKEQTLLKFSTLACSIFAIFGIGLGIWVGSMVIVFDGAYSLVSLGLTLMSLIATMYIHPQKSTKSKPVSSFKAECIESSVVLIKGLVVAIVCLVSFYSALGAMFTGGREVDAGFALFFGVINVVGCLATYLALSKQAGKTPSLILRAESSQWLMDTVISAAVLLGFVATSILLMTDFAEYAVYADPLMVLLASVYFASVPIKMVTDASKNLLQLSHRHKGVRQLA